MPTYKIEIELTEEQVNRLIQTAVKRGSTNWANFETNEQGQTLVSERKRPEVEAVVLTGENIGRGCRLLGTEEAIFTLASIVSEDDGAEEADVFLQLCLYGSLAHGRAFGFGCL